MLSCCGLQERWGFLLLSLPCRRSTPYYTNQSRLHAATVTLLPHTQERDYCAKE